MSMANAQGWKKNTLNYISITFLGFVFILFTESITNSIITIIVSSSLLTVTIKISVAN